MSHRIFNYPQGKTSFPVIKSAQHKHIYDALGKDYLDFYLGAGSQILGHSCNEVVEAIKEQLSKGLIFAGESNQIHILGTLLEKVLPEFLRNYIFCSTGTEATTRALRYARLSTGRDSIACFKGGWHGMNEWTLIDGGGRAFNFSRDKNNLGIPGVMNGSVLQLEFNSEADLEILEKNAPALAAIILEPIPGSCPVILPEYLQRLELICKKYGVLIIYDEIISGFRLGLGGATELYQLKPDLVTYGKILGGGLPIGLVVMTDSVAETTFLDKSKSALAGGTFSANPLVAVAATKVLEMLQLEDYSRINLQGDKMRNSLNAYFNAEGLPLSMIGVGSISRLLFTNKIVKNRTERDSLEIGLDLQKKIIDQFYKKGIYWPPSGIIFNSFCHDDADILFLIKSLTDPFNYRGINFS